MKNVLILGAGQSAPYLINYMLKGAEKYDWNVKVCDMDYELAKSRTDGFSRGEAVKFNVNNEVKRIELIKWSDIVINFLAPKFQPMIAADCLENKKNCITASYTNPAVAKMNDEAVKAGIIIINEMGLDPGIDHMSAAAIIDDVKSKGGEVESFESYGGAIPAPDVKSNPLDYCITWNARNVAMAAEPGAQYLEDSKVKLLPHFEVFNRTWNVYIEGVGMLEAYPNRDSLSYIDVFDVQGVETMVRGTLRYPGFCETWAQIVKLGMANETLSLPPLENMSYEDYTKMFLPLSDNCKSVKKRAAKYLGISPTGKIMSDLEWLGLFSAEKIGRNFNNSGEVLTNILVNKLPLPKGKRDMVILAHEIRVKYADTGKKEIIKSQMVDFGQPDGFTAIAKTVGLPAAIAAKLILTGKLEMKGCHIPTHPGIYKVVLEELKESGIKFNEKIEEVN